MPACKDKGLLSSDIKKTLPPTISGSGYRRERAHPLLGPIARRVIRGIPAIATKPEVAPRCIGSLRRRQRFHRRSATWIPIWRRLRLFKMTGRPETGTGRMRRPEVDRKSREKWRLSHRRPHNRHGCVVQNRPIIYLSRRLQLIEKGARIRCETSARIPLRPGRQ